jgi:hypothetical protein
MTINAGDTTEHKLGAAEVTEACPPAWLLREIMKKESWS